MHDYFKNKYYFINKLDTKYLNKQNKNTIIIYRNYQSKKIDKQVILKIKNFCHFDSEKYDICFVVPNGDGNINFHKFLLNFWEHNRTGDDP